VVKRTAHLTVKVSERPLKIVAVRKDAAGDEQAGAAKPRAKKTAKPAVGA